MDENVNSCSGTVLCLCILFGPQPMPLLKCATSVHPVLAGTIALAAKFLKTVLRVRNNALDSSLKPTIQFLVQKKQVTSKVVRQRVYAKELKLPKCVTIFDGETLERELAVKSSVPLEISQTKKSHQVLIKRVFHSKIESFYPRMSPTHFSAFVAFVSVRLLVTFVLK